MPTAIQHAADERASAAVRVAVKELDGAIKQLRNAVQGGTSNPDVEAALRRAMDAVEQAKPLIDALPDSKKKFGLLMFLQEHLERFQEATNGLGTSSQS